MICLPFGLAALIGLWWNQREQRRRAGAIRLPGENGGVDRDSKLVQTIASVPYFVAGVAGQVFSRVLETIERVPFLRRAFGAGGYSSSHTYGGYRTLRAEGEFGPHDEDAEVC